MVREIRGWHGRLVVIIIAIVLGALEAAWTREEAGGPASTWMGVFALLAIFVALLSLVGWKLWLIPGLAILEEGTHLILTYLFMVSAPLTWEIIYRQVFHHWSVAYIGVNLYLWILFPVIVLVGELVYWRFTKSSI